MLSASRSPPLFCGIPEALAPDEPDPDCAADDVVEAGELADEDDFEPPHPATSSASATRATPSSRRP